MKQYKDMWRVNPRKRRKVQIIVSCVALVALTYVIYRVLSNSKTIWLKLDKEYDINLSDFILDDLVDLPPQPFRGEKLIHLDLKGAPPLVSYLKEFLRFIKKLGATGVLIEYEDMFPYKDELEDIRALNAYKPSDIKAILESADALNLTVIPLIQTFGHFEFVLKLEKFKHLREVDTNPQVLCPNHEKVNFVIRKMIDQVLEAHPRANYIHIGCDEVYHLGVCERCRTVLTENKWHKSHLFLNHVKNTALYINKTYPDVRPIIWADMIGTIGKELLKKSEISSLVDLMVWKYVPDVSQYITSKLLSIYAKLFKNIWIASAFKGATGVNQIVTNATYHLENHIAWMKIVAKWKRYINFKGIAITGWQRYDHFSVLCELLPVGIPSLALSMNYLRECDNGTNCMSLSMDCTKKSEMLYLLQCDSPIPLNPDEVKVMRIPKCKFPGSGVFELISKLFSLYAETTARSSLMNGWFSVYNIIHKFSSPYYVKRIFYDWPLDYFWSEITSLEKELREALSEIYDEHTVREWLLTHLIPIRLRLEAYYNVKEAFLDRNVWPRRPFTNTSDALEETAAEICNLERRIGCVLLLD